MCQCRHLARSGLVACLLLAGRAVGEEPRIDAHDDSLPPFAQARLGTTRFHDGGRIAEVRFSPDVKTLLSIDANNVARAWETATGRELYHFTVPAFSHGRADHMDGTPFISRLGRADREVVT